MNRNGRDALVNTCVARPRMGDSFSRKGLHRPLLSTLRGLPMRIPLATSGFLFVGLVCAPAWSQSPDPFGQRDRKVLADPFNSDAKVISRPTLDAPENKQRTPRRSTRSTRSLIIRDDVGSGKMVLRNARNGDSDSPSNPSQTRERIQSALDSKTTQTFIELPLSEAIQTLSETHDIPMVIDHRGLEEIGLDAEAGVSIDMKNMSLRGFLRLMLRDLDLTYMVREEYLEITTFEEAENRLATEMYLLPDAIVPRSDDVIEVMAVSINPGTWEARGGSSNAIAFDHVLVVSTTSDTHDRLGKFLEELFKKYGNGKE